MKTLSEVGERLQAARKDRRLTQQELAARTGLTPVTLRSVFSGQADARMSTVMALADQLGLELLLVPKEISASLEPRNPEAPQIQSKISQILHRGS